MNCLEVRMEVRLEPVPNGERYRRHGPVITVQGPVINGESDSCPERTARLLLKSGWCFTEYGWSHEKIAPVFVAWREAMAILAMRFM
ncbi:MAG TPA: hypothetical protein VMJ66_08470 [Geobacteraceae bacterium]|nr:hypothetical protein [Geobacteraceae bacterium]